MDNETVFEKEDLILYFNTLKRNNWKPMNELSRFGNIRKSRETD